MTKKVSEPYRGEVRGSKGSVFYRTHSYHTKVPPEGIVPFIEYYTDPGDTVVDPFCGSGMTGVAALQTGRHGILSDLSPAAVHIASNNTGLGAAEDIATAARNMLAELQDLETELYETVCTDCTCAARIEYTVWSDTLVCPSCGDEVLYWDAARAESGDLRKDLTCTNCGHQFRKTKAQVRPAQPVLVSVSCSSCKSRQQRPLTESEKQAATLPRRERVSDWYPTSPLHSWREMWRGQHRDMGIATSADFFTDRNLQALAAAWRVAQQTCAPQAMRFAVTAIVNRASKRYQWNPKRPTNVLSGTLYIASLTYEFNVMSLLRRKLRAVEQLAAATTPTAGTVTTHLASATNLEHIADHSVDYVFTDPPFGANIYYSDASFLWEAWLDNFTDATEEAVVSTSLKAEKGGKTLDDYEKLMTESFGEIARILKPGAWASVMFHNSDDAVWSTIVRAIDAAGLCIESAVAFDKSQPSFKGIKQITHSERVSSFDLVLQLREGVTNAEPRAQTRNRDDNEILRLLTEHLTTATPRQRTTPYLHSYVMRILLERGWPLTGLSYAGVEDLLAHNFDLKNAAWALRSPLSEHTPGANP